MSHRYIRMHLDNIVYVNVSQIDERLLIFDKLVLFIFNDSRLCSAITLAGATCRKRLKKTKSTMAGLWLWLGSSNSKAYKTQFDNEKRKFELCMKAEQFLEHFASLKDKCDFATVSGLDNILADYTKGEWDEPQLLDKMDKMFKTLEEQRQEGVRILIEPLIPWRKHTEVVKQAGIDVIKNMRKNYPGIHFASRPASLRFVTNGVHLDERSSRKLFKSTFDASEKYFNESEDDKISDHETQEEDNNIEMGSDEEIEFIGTSRGKKQKTRDWNEETEND